MFCIHSQPAATVVLFLHTTLFHMLTMVQAAVLVTDFSYARETTKAIETKTTVLQQTCYKLTMTTFRLEIRRFLIRVVRFLSSAVKNPNLVFRGSLISFWYYLMELSATAGEWHQ